MSIDLRLGRYQDVLADVECDTLIVDAPYSAKTHGGHDSGVEMANTYKGKASKRTPDRGRTALGYKPWTPRDVNAFVKFWAPRTRGWFVTITDHVLQVAWAKALARQGRYVFSPLAFVEPGSRVRMVGDGPAQWACWIIVARPRSTTFSTWGALQGAYVVPSGLGEKADVINFREPRIAGAKPLWLMRSLVRDYSRPGQVVCDPCSGSGTTLIAAAMENRKAVGAELAQSNYEMASKRIARGYTTALSFEDRPVLPTQLALGAE